MKAGQTLTRLQLLAMGRATTACATFKAAKDGRCVTCRASVEAHIIVAQRGGRPVGSDPSGGVSKP